MGLISVTQIGCPHGVLEVGGTLCIVVSSAVFIVESESTTQLFVGIHGKDSLEVVFSIGTVTTTVQCHVRERRVGVGKVEIAHWGYDVVVWFCKHEVTLCTSVDEDTVDSCSTHVTQGIVLSVYTLVEGSVHIQMLQCVDGSFRSVSESFVYGPHLDSLRDFLVRPE